LIRWVHSSINQSMLLAAADDKLPLPSPARVGGVLLLVALVFSGTGAAMFYLWSEQPETVDGVGSSTGWRVQSADNSTLEWRVCAMQLFADDDCEGGSIDLASATPIASAPVPSGFGIDSCEQMWSSGTNDTAPYLGWRLPQPEKVGCILVLSAEAVLSSCTDSVYWCFDCSLDSCDSCCESSYTYFDLSLANVQVLRGEEWVTLKQVGYTHYSYASTAISMSTAPLVTETNSLKTVFLVTGIVLVVLGGSFLLIAVPVGVFAVMEKLNQLKQLQAAINDGSAKVCHVDNEQWFNFVRASWGPGGTVRKEQPGAVIYAVAGVLGIGVLTLLIKFRSFLSSEISDRQIGWRDAAIIAAASSLSLSAASFLLQTIATRMRYAKLQRQKYPIVLGPKAAYFAGVALFARVQQTLFVRTPTGCNISIVYIVKVKYSANKHKLTAPISEADLPAVKAFVLQHKEFYKPKTTAAPAPRTVTTSPIVVQADSVVVEGIIVDRQ